MTNLSYSDSSLPEVKLIQLGPGPQACKNTLTRQDIPRTQRLSPRSLSFLWSVQGLSNSSLLSQLFTGHLKKQANGRKRKSLIDS